MEKLKNINTKNVGLLLGPVLFFLFMFFIDLDPQKPELSKMAAVASLMAVWWITDAIPLFATALLPLIFYPFLGIMPGKSIAPYYINSTIFLFIGGFLIALTMEKWNLHKRIALKIIKLIGNGTGKIIFGFMIASAFLSMWISNTATAIMMLPIGLAIILRLEEKYSPKQTKNFSLGLLLGIAYGCSLGGIATLVGTPPNLSFARIFQIMFPEAPPITFGSWIVMALPITLILLILVFFVLTKIFYRIPKEVDVDVDIVEKEYKELGPIGFEEKSILIVFTLTALLWIFRKKLSLGFFEIPGWSELIPNSSFLDDGTIALTMAFILFLIPAKSSRDKNQKIMGKDVISKLPWNIVLLFGGGFALAKGFMSTGLSDFIGNSFGGLSTVPPIILLLFVCLGLTFLTELTSNTATTEMILPIIAAVSIAMKINPLFLMIPATLSASCAFMMPVATPPNAMIFGSSRIKILEMAKPGFMINIAGAILITIIFYFIGTAVFGIDLTAMPNWAQ